MRIILVGFWGLILCGCSSVGWQNVMTPLGANTPKVRYLKVANGYDFVTDENGNTIRVAYEEFPTLYAWDTNSNVAYIKDTSGCVLAASTATGLNASLDAEAAGIGLGVGLGQSITKLNDKAHMATLADVVLFHDCVRQLNKFTDTTALEVLKTVLVEANIQNSVQAAYLAKAAAELSEAESATKKKYLTVPFLDTAKDKVVQVIDPGVDVIRTPDGRVLKRLTEDDIVGRVLGR